MNNVKVSQYRVFNNVSEFAALYPEVYPAGSYGRQLVTDLKGIVLELQQLTASQTSGITSARESSTALTESRSALLGGLHNMSASARGLSVAHPEIGDKFVLPHNVNDDAFPGIVENFAREATPMADLFIKFGLPATFIEDLKSQLKAFQDAAFACKKAQESHVAATSAIEEAANRGRAILLQLDPITRISLAGNSFMLTRWEKARRFHRATSSKASKAAATDGASQKPPDAKPPEETIST